MDKKILIVDDDEGMRDNLADILQDEGYVLYTAANCAEAIKLAEAEMPHAAILDLKLPDDTGLNLMADLKRINAECVCVLATAYADLDSAISALDKGAFQYLQKPVRTIELIKLLERIFEMVQIRDEKNRAERKLRQSEERFRTLFETARDGIFIKDQDLKYTLVNPSMERLYDQKALDFIGKKDAELFNDPSRDHKERIEKRVLQGEIIEEEEQREVNGDERHFHTIKVPMVGNALSVTGLCGFTRDITETKRLESQLLHAQKMEAVGILAGGISHDFNNLLQAILGYCQMLLLDKEEADPDVVKLQEIEDAANRARDLVKQLLAFSRKVESKLRPVALNHEVHKLKRLLSRTFTKMIDIHLVLQDRVHTINGDPGQLEQVMLNVCVNAKDAMPDGGKLTLTTSNVKLDEEFCRTHMDAKPGEYVRLSIADTGHGMDAKTMTHVFEPFYSTKPTGEGTGLGMAMAYGIVKNHHGAIVCESQKGMGTTFHIYLPAAKAGVKKAAAKKKTKLQKGSGETILVIEDEAVLRKLMKQALTLNGYDVKTAENGEDGMAIYEKDPGAVSLIILDLIMPGMGGKQCMRELMRTDPEAKVIIASGYTSATARQEISDMGAAGFIEKPYDFQDIFKIIKEVIQ